MYYVVYLDWTSLSLLSLLSHLSNVQGDVEWVEQVVDGTGGEHKAGINGSTNNSTQRIPFNKIDIIG